MAFRRMAYSFPVDPGLEPPVQVVGIGRDGAHEHHRRGRAGGPPRLSFEYVVRGRMTANIDSESYPLSAGDVIILPYDRPSMLDSLPGVPWFKAWITAQGNMLDALVSAYNLKYANHVAQCPVKHLYKRAFRISASADLDRHEKQKQLTVTFYELLVELAAVRARRRSSISEAVFRMKSYLDNRIEEKVSLDELSELTHLCKAHLIRTFKQEMGVSPYAYLLTQKLEHAKLLLSTSDLRVKEVARRVGFSNEYYFSNVFKARTGVAPSGYREKTIPDSRPPDARGT
ncbi:MAG: AraC family transcriptional regulator [Kiritimatiellae bacterium]|nr:AraC family transcriptional regulator [Kiritimatiellia bacterium]